MIAVVLGLAASLSFGLADFIGGLKSRIVHVAVVLAVSQSVALALLAVAALVAGEGPPDPGSVALAGLAGMAGIVGLAAFYRALAVGSMAVVAPIGGLAPVLPVLVGLATGDRPGAVAIAGIALALAGVVLASREAEPEQAAAAGRTVAAGSGLALLAAVGFGSFMLGLDSAADAGVLWALLVARVVSVVLVAGALVVLRPNLAGARGHLGPIAAVGVLDLGANVLFALAATEGLVSLASVLSSLYPVVTLLLALALLGERLQRSQLAGVALVLAGVAAIAAA